MRRMLRFLPLIALMLTQARQGIEPFRMIGNIYYVGERDVTSYLITTPAGHILIDTGYEETAPIIKSSVEKLGFRVIDIKIMLSGHAHFDHVGGHATMKQLSGARIFATAEDAVLIESGGKKDFRWGNEVTFKPAKVDRILEDGEAVTLGSVTLVPHIVPGHTKGNTAWTMQVEEEGKKHDVVFTASISINPGVRMVDYAPFRGIAKAYAKSFDVLKSLKCDVFLGPHGGFYGLDKKIELLKSGAKPNPFIDPSGYRRYLELGEKTYLEQLKGEKR